MVKKKEVKKEKSFFHRVFLVVIVILLINAGMFLYKYGDFSEGVTGFSIKETISEAYQNTSQTSKNFLIAQWGFLIFALLLAKPKRAQAQIITVVLIILLVITSVLIVWNIFKLLVEDKSEEIGGVTMLTVDLEIDNAFIPSDDFSYLKITIKRNAGEGDIKFIKFILEDNAKRIYITNAVNPIPGPLETLTYELNSDNNPGLLDELEGDFSEISKVCISFGIITSSGKIINYDIQDCTPANYDFEGEDRSATPGGDYKSNDELGGNGGWEPTTCSNHAECPYYKGCFGEQCVLLTVTGQDVLNITDKTYILVGDLEDNDLTDNFIKITASGITLDCKGYYIKSDDEYSGVYSGQPYTTIRNCDISMGGIVYGGFGIELVNADNSYIHDNILDNQIDGLYLNSVQDATIEGNTANSNTINGIFLSASSDNTLRNNIANLNNNIGIVLVGGSDNIIIDNIINSNFANEISLGDSSGNMITANSLWDCNTECIFVGQGSNSNIFDSNKINKSSNYGITVGGNNNLFKNTNMINIGGNPIFIIGGKINNTFLNVSYYTFDESVELGGELIRKWYVDIYVDNGTVPVGDATVEITNDGQPDVITQADGYTPRQEITEYKNNGGAYDWKTLSLLATKTGYNGATFGSSSIGDNRVKENGNEIRLSLSTGPPPT